MVIEAGVAVGYVIAWAVRKARRVGGRLDDEADELIDAGLDHLHAVVAAKLSGHPALAELVEEAEQAVASDGQISELTRQQVELALSAAARKDETFGQAVTEALSRLQEAEQAADRSVIAGPGSAVFTGDFHTRAEGQGIAIGQVAGGVHINRGPTDPPGPGRLGH